MLIHGADDFWGSAHGSYHAGQQRLDDFLAEEQIGTYRSHAARLGGVATRALAALVELVATQLRQIIGSVAHGILGRTPSRTRAYHFGYLRHGKAVRLRGERDDGVHHATVAGLIQINAFDELLIHLVHCRPALEQKVAGEFQLEHRILIGETAALLILAQAPDGGSAVQARRQAVDGVKSLPSTKQLPLLATVSCCRLAACSTHSWLFKITCAPNGG